MPHETEQGEKAVQLLQKPIANQRKQRRFLILVLAFRLCTNHRIGMKGSLLNS